MLWYSSVPLDIRVKVILCGLNSAPIHDGVSENEVIDPGIFNLSTMYR
jgi:hypothetical protein